MPLRRLGAVLLLLLAACGSSSAASEVSATATTAHGSATCGPANGRTLAASRQARVYELGNEVYGCALGGRGYRLGVGARLIHGGRVAPVAVAGTNAGYGLSNFGVDTVSAQVLVRNLTNGKALHQATAASRILVESFQTIDSIVIKANGSVAWISEVGSVISHGRYLEVHRIDARGATLLDSGPGIVSRSLRLHGSTLTWRDGSRTRSTALR